MVESKVDSKGNLICQQFFKLLFNFFVFLTNFVYFWRINFFENFVFRKVNLFLSRYEDTERNFIKKVF